MCRHNKRVVEEDGTRPDLVQCWSLAEMIATPLSSDFESDEMCSQNPFAKTLLESL